MIDKVSLKFQIPQYSSNGYSSNSIW